MTELGPLDRVLAALTEHGCDPRLSGQGRVGADSVCWRRKIPWDTVLAMSQRILDQLGALAVSIDSLHSDPSNARRIVQRWEKLTGKKADRVSS